MAEELPQPLTPAECELQDFKFMPLDVARLRSSEQNSDVTPEANWAALQLWAAAWHEVPAGSIPDNDQWQAKACGYVSLGTINPRWQDVREGALRKFVKCSDGRLYHPVVAEKAREAWLAKLEQRWKTECGRIKKHNDRNELKGPTAVPKPSYDEWIAAGRPTGQPLPVPSDKKPMSPRRPRGQALQGTGKGQGQGQGLIKNPSGSDAAAAPRPAKKAPKDFEVTSEMVIWAEQTNPGVDLNRETDKFRNHTFGVAKVDWVGTWKNWIYRAHEDLVKRGPPASGETAFQRSQREKVERATGGLAARKPTTTEVPHVARPPAARLG